MRTRLRREFRKATYWPSSTITTWEALRTLAPLRMQVEPLGCTCTLIAEAVPTPSCPAPRPDCRGNAGSHFVGYGGISLSQRQPARPKSGGSMAGGKSRGRDGYDWLGPCFGHVCRARCHHPAGGCTMTGKSIGSVGMEIGIGQTELTEIEKFNAAG
jgi:hypothetical protein